MAKPKIAIIGSCASRDNFNSHFVENYKDLYECVHTQSKISMPSLVAPAIPFDHASVDGPTSDVQKRLIITELDKSVWNSLAVNEPDYILIDFYADVWNGIIEVDDSIISGKLWGLEKTTLGRKMGKTNTLTLQKNPDEYLALWKRSVDEVFARIEKLLPYTKVILNDIRFATQCRDAHGNVQKINERVGKPFTDTDLANGWMAEMGKYVAENHDVIHLEYDREFLADLTHKWGFHWMHYTPDFYQVFTHKLSAILLNELSTELEKVQEANGTNRTKPFRKVDSEINLVQNPNFEFGSKMWSHWDDDFDVIDKPAGGGVSISREGLTQTKNAQLYSCPVEFHADGLKEFELSFEVKCADWSKVDSHGHIFSIRTHKDPATWSQGDSSWYKYLNISTLRQTSEWQHVSVIVRPSAGRFIKVGPYLFQNGDVSWRNIRLQKHNS